MAEHRASCQCGQLSLVASEDPDFVIVCNCIACQKRTGSPFGTGQYFRKDVVKVSGEFKSWARGTDTGKTLTNHFCPDCGGNLLWSLDLRPDHYGVGIGNFDTPKLTPTRVVWAEEKLKWVQFPEDWECFQRGSQQSS